MIYSNLSFYKKKHIFILWLLGLTLFLSSTFSLAQPLSVTEQLIESYADILINKPDQDQEKLLEGLIQQAEIYRDENPKSADAWITLGRVRSGYATTKGLRALRIMKKVRDEYEQAIELDRNTQQGLAQAGLGMYYSLLPGWPISFGNDEKGIALLEEAMTINSENMANNYYYALYLINGEKKFTLADDYLQRAKNNASTEPRLPNLQTLLLGLIEDNILAIADKK